MTAKVSSPLVSRSLPNYQWEFWQNKNKMKKRQSFANENLSNGNFNLNRENEFLNAEENKNISHLRQTITMPVKIERHKPLFEMSTRGWTGNHEWDSDEENYMTDSTESSTSPVVTFPDSVDILSESLLEKNLLDQNLLDENHLEENLTDSLNHNSDSRDSVTTLIGSSNELSLNSENIPNNINNNCNSFSNINNINYLVENNNNNNNNNIEEDHNPKQRLVYQSSSDSLSSYLSSSSYKEDYSEFTISLSSSSLTSEGETPRKRVRDSEGYIRRAACVCVNETENQVMLTSSKKCSDVWLVPGGGLEDGEQSEQAALREAWEEAGVKGRVARYLGVFQTQHEGSTKKHRTAVFVIVVTSLHDVFPEAHIGRARRWFSLEEATAKLNLHKPKQSAYLQFLISTKLNHNLPPTQGGQRAA